jgi:glycosyltransferase involved in cell wall biosynthesis
VFVRSDLTWALDRPDAVPVSGQDLCVKGWCFSKNALDCLEVIVYVDGTPTPAFCGLSRPDVARHFNNPSIEQCGFVARFRCPRETSEVSLFVRANGAEFLVRDHIKVPEPVDPNPSGRGIASYKDWLTHEEARLFWKEDEIPQRIAALEYFPLFSIILPTYNTPPYFLKRCIESVLSQHYSHWQLCIADDCSTDEKVLPTLGSYASKDSRIYLESRDQQGGISAASNLALRGAKGDFVLLLDHDDELHSHALLELAKALNSNDKNDLIYSDEDKVDRWGIRSQPAFKPDFDKDLFLSFNYLGHLIALRRSVVTEIGGFRSVCDGAQDWDLLIRTTEIISPAAIKHIRKPLYHWRMHEDSTSMNLDAKPYVAKAWAKVLQDHTERTTKKAKVAEGLFYGSMRLKYESARNRAIGIFLRPQDGVFQTAVVKTNLGCKNANIYQFVGCTVIAMPDDFLPSEEGASSDVDREGVVSLPTALCSVTEMEEDVLVFIDGQLEALNHLFFEELAAQAMRNECGLVAGISLNPDNQIIDSGLVRVRTGELIDPYVGINFGNHAYMGQLSVVRSLDAISGRFFAVRREHLAAVGGLGALSSTRIQRVARLLGKHAIDEGLSILFTPYAVATFYTDSEMLKQEATDGVQQDLLRLNPHLLEFRSNEMLQGRI